MQRIVFSQMVVKTGRWKQQSEVLFALSESGTIYLVKMKQHKLHRVIEAASLRALSWLSDEDLHAGRDFILHHASSYDHLLTCDSPGSRLCISRALKYLYWKMKRTNLPVYIVPVALKASIMTTRAMYGENHHRFPVPECYRAAEHDIYPEEQTAQDVEFAYAEYQHPKTSSSNSEEQEITS